MSLTPDEDKELKTLQLFIEKMEEHIIYKRKELKEMNTHFQKAKKRAKELINKQ